VKTYPEIKERINDKLALCNQILRIDVCTKNKWSVTNGKEFIGGELQNFRKRLIYSKAPIWYELFDQWITNEISELDVLHILAVKRGQKCQEIHKDHIRNNLNTGQPWIKGKKKNIDYKRRPLTEEQCDNMSKRRMGAGNPMYGKRHSEEVKNKHSLLMKTMIQEGRFTPNSNNRQTHYDVLFNGLKYRSSWEALYHSYNPQAKYEKLRIPYTHNNEERVYIVDFVDEQNKLVIEVKPRELTKDRIFKAKWESLVDWSQNNGYTVLLADQYWLVNNVLNPDLSKFDDTTARKLRILYETTKED